MSLTTSLRKLGVKRDHNADHILDLSPLFEMETYHGNYWYKFDDSILKCCCASGSCVFGNVSATNSCEGYSVRDRNGCGCLAGAGHKSYSGDASGRCLMSMGQAARSLSVAEDKVANILDEARTTRYLPGWIATYGECNVNCGMGIRQLTRVKSSPNHDPVELERVPGDFPDVLPCEELSGCEWKCQNKTGNASCGWRNASCSSVGGDDGPCELKMERRGGMQSKHDFGLDACFAPCTKQEALNSLCAVTSNHLDEQYGSVSSLISKTCFAEKTGVTPDLVVLMAQELNHANNLGIGANHFPRYVHPTAIPGYNLAAVCAPAMSANTAVFVRASKRSQIWGGSIECSNLTLRSKCAFTNCKGSVVLGLITASGKLVVGNWHGERGGTFSKERTEEFEAAASAIYKSPTYLGRKLVVWGGDINVRSDFVGEATVFGDVLLPEEIRRSMRGDALGEKGWDLDQHLRGEVGHSPFVKSALQGWQLRQAKGWDKLCPTYMKTIEAGHLKNYNEWDGTYTTNFLRMTVKHWVKKTEFRYNMACRTPADQLASGVSETEYLKALEGPGRAPSWTDRIFLSRELYDHCGMLKKDIRNIQTDHDPVYVTCSIPYELQLEF